MPSNLTIHGAAGRMGRRLIALAPEVPDLKLVGAVEFQGSPNLGADAGALAGLEPLGIPVKPRIDPRPDVVIDFSSPAGALALIDHCVKNRIALVIGTTGLGSVDHAAIDQAAKSIPILQAANMSLGVNLLIALVGKVAAQLGDDYDIEIVESHHRFKKDAPSGTALALAQAICDATGKSMRDDLVHGRHGDNATRRRGSIGMHALRQGDVVGRHTVTYTTLGEEIQLTHNASTRDVFARGALRAAAWLAMQKPARYSMPDVLGL